MTKWFGNDFAERIALPAERALRLAGFEVIDRHVSDSFDNGWIKFRSPQLALTIVRDRGSVEVIASPANSPEEFDFEALRRVLDGGVTYRAGLERYGGASAVPEHYPTLLTLLVSSIPRLIEAHSPSHLPATRAAVEAILKDRVAYHFPNWIKP